MMTTSNTPKYQLIADLIESEIRTGKWAGEKMPSVRDVAVQYSTSTVTASRAIQVIRDKGLIQSVERSGTFCLPARTADKFALALHVTAGPHSSDVYSTVRSGFERLARRDPIHLYHEIFRFEHDLTLNRATDAARAAMEEGIQGVVLLPSRSSDADATAETTFLRGCHQAELPAVLLERNLRGHTHLEYDLVALDDAAAASECTTHLIGLRRKRIGLAVASPTSTHHDRVAGYLRALHTHRRRPNEYPEHVIWLPDEVPTPQIGPYLVNEIRTRDLDALICYHDYIALAVLMELLHKGMKIPDQVAVVGFENLNLASVVPMGLTTYDYPAERLAEEAIRLLRERRKSPQRLPVKTVVRGELLIRGSSDPSMIV